MKIKDLFQKTISFFKNKTVQRVSIIVLALVLIAVAILVTVLTVKKNGERSDENICTVVFNSNGGSSVDSQRVNRGAHALEPESPIKEGYVLDGWSLNGERWDFSVDTVDRNIILDALWCEAVVLTFENEGDVSTVSVARGRAVDSRVVPTVDDPDFIGWFIGGVRWDASDAPETDLTLVAAYTADIVLEGIGESHVTSAIASAARVTLNEDSTSSSLSVSGMKTDADGYLNLYDYIRYMPNAAEMLSEHPELITSDGTVLSLPSRTGYDASEYLPFIREDLVRLMLDGDEPFSLDSNGVITDDVSPFINDLKFRASAIDSAGEVTEIGKNLNVSGNVLDILGDYLRYGELSATDAVGILRHHIDAAYGGYYGAERSRLFIGESAAYDTDELIMLLLCASACSDVLTDTEMHAMCVRTERELIYLMASLYGIKDIDLQMHRLTVSESGVSYRGEREDVSTAVRKINRLLGIGIVSFGEGECLMRFTSVYENIGDALTPILPPVSLRETYSDESGAEVILYSRITDFARYDTSHAFSVPISVADDERTLMAVLRFIDYTYSRECLEQSYAAFDGICDGEIVYTLRETSIYAPTTDTLARITDEYCGSATVYAESALGAGVITPLPTFGFSMLSDEQRGAICDILSTLHLLSE